MKNCILCKHFGLTTAEPDYSEETPGTNFAIFCFKNNWDFDTFNDDAEDFRRCLQTAETCSDYKHHKEEDEEC